MGWLVRALTMGGAITLLGSFANTFSENRVLAQITPDSTLGGERSVVTPNANVRGLPAELIEGGAVRGANLFHSFQEFNVGNGQRVYFANPAGIENILGRVTGNNLSKIFGTLGVDGGANLFLLNPNGIIFGPNARLDIAGSFVGSTANSLVFENGSKFSATNPEAPPLLTIKLRPGLQYGTTQPGATIANAGNLAVGKDLTLAAGNLDLQGQLYAGGDLTLFAQDTVKVRDRITNPAIAIARDQLLIQGNQKVDIFALNHPESGFFSGGDLVLRSGNSVIGDAHYRSDSNFRVEQLDGSLGNLESPNDPVFEVAGDFSLANYTGASLQILAGGSVNIPGNVTISGSSGAFNDSSVTLSDGTLLTISGTTQPIVDIRSGTTGFFGTPTPGTPTSANITIGSITVSAPNGLVFLSNQYQPNTALNGNIQVGFIRTDDSLSRFLGNSSSVVIDSRGDITVSRFGVIRTSSANSDAGDITLIANGSFFMRNGGLSTRTLGPGNAGNVNINVRDAVSLTESSFILTFVSSGAVGNSGNINIQAGSLLMDDTAGLQADTYGQGNAGSIVVRVNDSVSLKKGSFISSLVGLGGIGNGGNIQINASGSVNLSGFNPLTGDPSGLFVTTSEGASGQAGNITVNTGTLLVAAGAVVDASTLNFSDGGSITINADRLEVTRSGQVLALSSSAGNAGNVNLDTRQLDVSDGGVVFTGSLSTGDGGNLSITATDSVNILNPDSSVSTSALGSSGNSGNLSINTRQFNVSDRGLVTTGSTGAGDSGNLSVSTIQLNVSDAGEVSTTSVGTGNAGNLAIAATDSVNVSAGGLVTTGTGESSAGNGGNLSISTRRLDVSNGGLSTAALGQGNAGNLSVVATDSMNVVNQSNVTTSATEGVAGNLYIETGKLSIRDHSLVVTSTFGSGNSGDLTVRAANSVEIIDGSGLSSPTIGSGNGGDLRIETENLVVDGSKISADTFSSGNGGNLTIETGNLSVRNGGEISTGVFPESSGQGGNLSVNASNSVELNGGSLVTATLGTGRAGDLTVNTRTFTAQGGGRVEAGTVGLNQGGTVTVKASESIELSGKSPSGKTPTAISAFSRPPDDVDSNLWTGNANSGGVILSTKNLIIREGAEVTTAVEGKSQRGNAGDVQVQADSLSLINGGSITSRSEGQARAGDISVNLKDNLRSSGGIISATSTQAGGGNVNIDANDIRLRNSSLISTSVFDSTGGGGNIDINSKIFIALEDSDILANADAGPGGNITINSPVFLADLFSSGKAVAVGRNPGDFARFRGNGRVDISADSRTGTSGTVSLPTIDPTRGLTQLPSDLVDAERLIDRRCTPGGVAQRSSFTVTGRGGLPPNPNEPLRGEAVTADWMSIDFEEEKRSLPASPNPASSTPKKLVEAQGWVIGPDGRVILTAQAPTVTPQSPWLTSPSCQGSQTTTK